MDTAVIAATISGAVGLVALPVTYLFSKRREREAEWRKEKLEHYREFLAALSGIVTGRATPQGHARFADAVNSLTLVAPPEVIAKLYEFLDEVSFRNKERDQRRHDERLSALIQALRRDIQPGPSRADKPLAFRLIDVPPDDPGDVARSDRTWSRALTSDP
ncbi:MAG TPA: hypothetical protein VHG32_25800 [Thermoanaerobaculia bacterium]|jgi:hypothetical protein|nr:hypothetical protein [Thermoanaerobaculia bacterium]